MHIASSQAMEIQRGALGVEATWYLLYGLQVRSEVTLPLTASSRPLDQRVDMDIRFVRTVAALPTPDGALIAEQTCPGPCHGGDVYLRVHRNDAGGWFTNPRVGACFIAADGRRIDIYALPGA